ncbi:MAG: hypothetical protein U0640_03710 [Phycisphaerales bacterium]
MEQLSGVAGQSRSGLTADVDLQGSLPCVRCRYDLKGLSITSICPECGTPVRATILMKVDPHADELQPLFHPKLTAWGLFLWSAFALAGVLAAWLMFASHISQRWTAPDWIAWLVPGFTALSGICAIAMVKPHKLDSLASSHVVGKLSGAASAMAGMGVALYGPLVYCLYAEFVVFWPGSSVTGTFAQFARIACCVLMAIILFALRPNARLLAARSFLMRTGQQDRQQMASLIVVVLLLGVVETIALIKNQGANAELIEAIVSIMRVVFAALFTLGLISVVIDTWRLRKILAEPPLSLRTLITEGADAKRVVA